MSLRRDPKSRRSWLLAAALTALCLSILRALYLEKIGGEYTSCHGCFMVPALGRDAWLLCAMFAVLAFAAASPWRWPARIARVVAAFGILAQATDLVLLRLFNQRFYIADLLRFSGDAAAGWSVARAQFFSINGIGYAAAAAIVLIVLAGLIVGGHGSPKRSRTLFVLAAISALFAFTSQRMPLRYVHEEYVGNVMEVNLPPGRAREFSPDYAQKQLRLDETVPQTCDAGSRSGRNIVIVITESLSAYQSALLGGPRDWLPRLDAIARENHYFTHFYANGFTTDGGEIAILTGRSPLIPPGHDWYSLKAFGAGTDTLPGIAGRAGYEAAHFTTESLSFLDQGTWLREFGFDHVEGSENQYYAKLPRGQFGAAEDAALFGRFEQWLEQRRDPRPFLAVLLTVSGHPPFVNPRTSRIDPPGTFHYVDDQLADFHDALAKRGFFDNGILLITGDHHSMTPIEREEYAKFGERSFARIPLIVAGAVDMPKVVDAPFQQSDFPASLAHIMGVDYCRTPFSGIFLDPKPQPPRYVVQARGDDRNRVDVYYDDRVASYMQNGDASGWAGAPPPQADMVAAWINSQRMRNGATPGKP
ncbi:MAG: LTA synthase family protein [Xanthomonadales bacterium PRO7]|nr:LTA synthase family protein [Xanthomonadales bacterium PRO7]HMM56455.1 LTA synthase family protein [Rudaea sp.]